MSKPRPIKVTGPQIRALRSCLLDHFRATTGHHDGMTLKACRTRGWLDGSNCLTGLGFQVLINHDELASKAVALAGKFDKAGYWHNGRLKACRRFCPDQHTTWTRDGLGNSVEQTHHHTDYACTLALAEAGKTWEQICWAFS